MRRKLNRFASPVIALMLFAVLLLSPAMTSGQKKKSPSGGGGGGGNCASCASRAQRACEKSEDPRACFEQKYAEDCVAFYGCSVQTNPF